MIPLYFVLIGLWVFTLGTVIGSFLNVCIYRLPWQKSVVWPASHCPHCMNPIAARDNVPIASWIALGGACRRCGATISVRYLLVELLVGLLFAGMYTVDVALDADALRGSWPYVRLAYHLTLVVFLVAAMFIDYDFQIIPDSITVPGMLLGLAGGMAAPWVRLEPGTAATAWSGLAVGLVGLLVGGALTQLFRLTFSLALRREAMGFGDVTLMAMIGAFLGWQGAVLAFFLAPFFGFLHAGWKLLRFLRKLLSGGRVTSADREMPFGPYLSMAAITLMLAWPWVWENWARDFFQTAGELFRFLVLGDASG